MKTEQKIIEDLSLINNQSELVKYIMCIQLQAYKTGLFDYEPFTAVFQWMIKTSENNSK